ncbi:MCE family protein [Actinocorallia longicatena]|uniref:Phospholipid/cholesterol/gamma-HCH transport system substrate-binding protein n=1 Tax=Actinocorallia longicatena TaxID=111803 RepID=A0ABP6Q4A8_9ACTN
MNRRVLLNLTVFALLASVVVVWAAFGLFKLKLTDEPYRVTVEFGTSPGLRPGFDAAYLGVRIGTVRAVRLADRKVVVDLEVDHDARVPASATASARRKSAVGEPYVEFEPAPGDQGTGPFLSPGAVVPVERTSRPLSYNDLFGSTLKLLRLLSPQDTRKLVHELAVGWNGRGESLAEILDGADQLTSAFAGHATELDTTYRELAKITHTYAAKRTRLARGLDDLATTTSALADLRHDLAKLRDTAPGTLKDLNGLLDAMPQAGCLLDAVGGALPEVFSTARARDLDRTLAAAPALVKVLNDVSGGTADKPVLRANVVVTLLSPKPAVEFERNQAVPTVPAVPTCDGTARPTARTPGTAAEKAGARPAPATPAASGPTGVAVTNSGGGSALGPSGWLVYLPPILALAVLVKAGSGTLTAFVRNARNRRR